METFSALLAICAGKSLVTGEFPAKRPVTGIFDIFFDLRLNERWCKQSWGWWFETPLHPLWRHCNDHSSVRGCVYHRFESYLCNRFQCVAYDSVESSLGSIQWGAPQGSILGPLFFLLHINDLSYAGNYIFLQYLLMILIYFSEEMMFHHWHTHHTHIIIFHIQSRLKPQQHDLWLWLWYLPEGPIFYS